nr:DUF5320 domain-containing protein [Paenibacillus xylanexedens]
MFKTEIEVKGIHIDGWIKKGASSEYYFYPDKFSFTDQNSLSEEKISNITSELNQIKNKLSELNKPLTKTRHFIPVGN